MSPSGSISCELPKADPCAGTIRSKLASEDVDRGPLAPWVPSVLTSDRAPPLVPYASQEIFKEFPDLGIETVPMREFCYCNKCEGIANESISPHNEGYRLAFRGIPMQELPPASTSRHGGERKGVYTFVPKPLSMAEMKVYISDSLDVQLREAAMKRFGYGRGSISKAVETAVAQWLKTEAAVKGAMDALVSRAKNDRNAVAVILFGSYARKEPAFGDVDIALVLKDPRGSDLLAYEKAIEGRGAFSPIKIDVVAFDSLPLDLKRRVLNEGVVLYAADERELRAVAAEVAEKWSDFAPTLGYLSA